MTDVPSILLLPIDDMRLMLNIEAFSTRGGSLYATRLGAFPVNRAAASPITRTHCVDVLRAGSGLCIFPEGGFQFIKNANEIGPFFKGAAAAGILGEAESLVPISIHYAPDTQPRSAEGIAGLLAAVSLSIAVFLSPDSGQPLLSALGLGLCGALLLAKIAYRLAPEREYWNPFPRYLARLGGGLLGGVLGAVGGYLWRPGTTAAEVVLCVACGVGTLGMAEARRRRLVQKIKIGTPIPATEYIQRAKADRKGAVVALTTALHQSLGKLKADLSGVPYNAQVSPIATERPVPSSFARPDREECPS